MSFIDKISNISEIFTGGETAPVEATHTIKVEIGDAVTEVRNQAHQAENNLFFALGAQGLQLVQPSVEVAQPTAPTTPEVAVPLTAHVTTSVVAETPTNPVPMSVEAEPSQPAPVEELDPVAAARAAVSQQFGGVATATVELPENFAKAA